MLWWHSYVSIFIPGYTPYWRSSPPLSSTSVILRQKATECKHYSWSGNFKFSDFTCWYGNFFSILQDLHPASVTTSSFYDIFMTQISCFTSQTFLYLLLKLKMWGGESNQCPAQPSLSLYEASDATCDSANKELRHSVDYITTVLETPWAWWCSQEDNANKLTSVSAHIYIHTYTYLERMQLPICVLRDCLAV